MPPEAAFLLSLATMVGIPLAVWAQLSIAAELERTIRRCKDCTVCRAKKEEERQLRRENTARSEGVCVKGHGKLRDGTCNVCGWN